MTKPTRPKRYYKREKTCCSCKHWNATSPYNQECLKYPDCNVDALGWCDEWEKDEPEMVWVTSGDIKCSSGCYNCGKVHEGKCG